MFRVVRWSLAVDARCLRRIEGEVKDEQGQNRIQGQYVGDGVVSWVRVTIPV